MLCSPSESSTQYSDAQTEAVYAEPHVDAQVEAICAAQAETLCITQPEAACAEPCIDACAEAICAPQTEALCISQTEAVCAEPRIDACAEAICMNQSETLCVSQPEAICTSSHSNLEIFTVVLKTLEISPEGHTTANPVPGIIFTLSQIGEIHKELGQFTTCALGEITVSGLTRGNYVFTEIFPGEFWKPYNGLTEYFFTLDNDLAAGDTITVMAYNQRLS